MMRSMKWIRVHGRSAGCRSASIRRDETPGPLHLPLFSMTLCGLLVWASTASAQSRRFVKGVEVPPGAPPVSTSATALVSDPPALNKDDALRALQRLKAAPEAERCRLILSARNLFPDVDVSTNFGKVTFAAATLNRYGIGADGFRFKTPRVSSSPALLALCAPTGSIDDFVILRLRDGSMCMYMLPVQTVSANEFDNPPNPDGSIMTVWGLTFDPDEEYVIWMRFRAETSARVHGGVIMLTKDELFATSTRELGPGVNYRTQSFEPAFGLRRRLTGGDVLLSGVTHSDCKLIDYALTDLHADINETFIAWYAGHDADELTLRHILARGADPKKANGGETCLTEVVARGKAFSPELVELLVKAGADVNGRNTYGQTPLMIAAGIVSVDTAKMLVKLGADTHVLDKDGHTLLEIAERVSPTSGDAFGPYREDRELFIAFIKPLIGKADTLETKFGSWAPERILEAGINDSRKDMVAYALKRGVNLRERPWLFEAAAVGDAAVVQQLVDVMADAKGRLSEERQRESMGPEGLTLGHAVLADWGHVLKAKDPAGTLAILAKAGCDLNGIEPQFGQTPLTRAVIWEWPQIIRGLCAAGADRSKKNSQGQTAADLVRMGKNWSESSNLRPVKDEILALLEKGSTPEQFYADQYAAGAKTVAPRVQSSLDASKGKPPRERFVALIRDRKGLRNDWERWALMTEALKFAATQDPNAIMENRLYLWEICDNLVEMPNISTERRVLRPYSMRALAPLVDCPVAYLRADGACASARVAANDGDWKGVVRFAEIAQKACAEYTNKPDSILAAINDRSAKLMVDAKTHLEKKE